MTTTVFEDGEMKMFEKMKTISLAACALAVMLALPHAAFAHDDDRYDRRGHHNGHNGRYDDDGDNRRYRKVYTPHYYAYPQYVYHPPVVVYPRPYVGQRLVTYYPIPSHVRYRLGPCPRGYYYSYHNDNVFLVRQQDNVIAQIISLLVN